MEKLIPAADDGSEFAEVFYDMKQDEAERELGAEFDSNAGLDALEEENHG